MMAYCRRFGFWLLIVGLLFGAGTGIAAAQDGQTYLPALAGGPNIGSMEAVALQVVSEETGIPVADLWVYASATATYPSSGVEAFSYKVLSSVNDEVYGVAVTPEGAIVDPGDMAAAEVKARDATYGKLDPELAVLLSSESAPNAVEVLVWVNTPEIEPSPRPSVEALEAAGENAVALSDEASAAADAQIADFMAEATAATVAALESMGLIVQTNEFLPAVSTTMSPAQIQEVASWDGVNRIYWDAIQYPDFEEPPVAEAEPELEISVDTTHVGTVHRRNILGFGVKIGQTEVGGRVSEANPYLDLYDAGRVANNNSNVCTTPSDHSTGVAGIQVSAHPGRFGYAPGARLYAAGSCLGYTSQLLTAATNAIGWGARSINNSWGSLPGVNEPTSTDRAFDTYVINNHRTFVKSAGNEANGCRSGTGRISSPGMAFNIITVGNFDDRNTAGWSGDVMQSCSSYVDPNSTHSDRDKPEIAAPGANINSTTTSAPWTGAIGTGTSYSAPSINASTALLMQRNPGLRSWPEAIKAILMATAIHNIEGAERLSDKDGAGALYMPYADDVARGVRGGWGGQRYNCSTVSPLNKSINLVAGKRTRVVIAWDQNPDYALYEVQPSADLDMQIRNPSGGWVTGSGGFDDNYEIVDFTPTETGSHQIRILKFRCDMQPKWLAWAWWRAP